MRPLVVVPSEVPAPWLASLREHSEPELEIAVGLDALPRARWSEIEGLISLLTMSVDAALLARMPKLRVVSNMAVGYDNVDVASCRARGIAVGNTPGVLTESTADLTMALLLSAARLLPQAARDAREGRWSTWSPDGWLGVELSGATLGIVGLGKIGRAVARRAQGFGMRVLYLNRSPREPEAGLTPVASLAELLPRVDFLSLHVPATPATTNMIDAEALALLRPSAMLINTARGSVVDQHALLAALNNGSLRAAALDVTTPEPLPPTHPLYAAPNCLILPHIGSATQTTRQRMASLACANLLAGVTGNPLPHQVP